MPVVAVEVAAFLVGTELPAHVVSCRLATRSVSKGVVLAPVVAVVQERKQATMAFEEVVVAGTGFSFAQLPHFELAS